MHVMYYACDVLCMLHISYIAICMRTHQWYVWLPMYISYHSNTVSWSCFSFPYNMHVVLMFVIMLHACMENVQNSWYMNVTCTVFRVGYLIETNYVVTFLPIVHLKCSHGAFQMYHGQECH